MLKKSALTFIPAAFLMMIGLSACETAEGFGEDLENAGEAIQDEAND